MGSKLKQLLKAFLGGFVFVLLCALFFAPTVGQAQTGRWYGAPEAPYWMKTRQGNQISYGSVTCAAGGTTFLSSDSTYRQSLMLQNTDGTNNITVCPAALQGKATDGQDTDCSTSIGWVISPGSALVLDKSNRAAASSGWKCFGSGTGTNLRYIAEERY